MAGSTGDHQRTTTTSSSMGLSMTRRVDGLIRRMYVGRERENSAHERGPGRAYFARPSRVSQLSLALGHVSLRVTTSHHLLISSVFVYVDRFILRCEYNYASRLRRVITYVTSSCQRGVPVSELMKRTRHKAVSSLTVYMKSDDVFSNASDHKL